MEKVIRSEAFGMTFVLMLKATGVPSEYLINCRLHKIDNRDQADRRTESFSELVDTIQCGWVYRNCSWMPYAFALT